LDRWVTITRNCSGISRYTEMVVTFLEALGSIAAFRSSIDVGTVMPALLMQPA